jgi:hypothetical protein
MRFIMIGGFLGAGKTTTLARLAQHYQSRGRRVGLVTNDQAQNLVDTNSLRAQGLTVEEVPGACFCCRFDDLVVNGVPVTVGDAAVAPNTRFPLPGVGYVILNEQTGKEKPEPNKYGVIFSQPHAVDLIDMDGDGLKDIVTGKRFWAHGNHGDADPNAPAVLYWFKLVRGKNHEVDFVPYLIDDNSGIGTQVVASKINGGKWPDIVVGNKKGTFYFQHEVKKVSKDEWEKAQPKAVVSISK